ncbi:hypothetical protein J4050_02605 [Winogradskyella sp. DF17]|uniref:Outer membrane protein beta-barrel domain-containing protein n=1 Tax=Winogradskyella pelagia TaxID=2819984 RepID=A0ABS3SYQ4_9FLAO|nr:hypothetical protein [Winogradskyella sp. DF17]MBO3115618.1 hypothetical protein [Winogradskyella sp. DF17]
MKKTVLFLLFSFLSQWQYGQQSYSINGEKLELKTEIEGNIDLLWNTIDNNFRYFVRTSDGTITELKNTKGLDKKYQEEYKTVLNQLTGKDTEKLKLTVYSLKNFLDAYNASVDSSYIAVSKEGKVGFRLGFSGGLTNNPFVSNPENKLAPLLGGELEIYEENIMPRHSGFLQLRHTFETNEFQYDATEFSLGYRFRVINNSKFSLYGQVKFATLNFTNATFIDANNMEASVSDTAFDIPFIFGIGSDIKIGENSYLTIIYGELFGIFLDNQGNFSTDISVGYKFNL